MRITLFGRNFSLIDGRATPPVRGDYVAYSGAFFPVSAKTGYPLSVVADIAAKVPQKIVLVPGEDGVYAFLSGSGRVIHTAKNPSNTGEQEKNEFYRSLLRLTLLSDHQEVVALGDIPLLGNTPCARVELADLSLPPVIRRSRSWLMLGLFGLVLLTTILSGVVIRSKARDHAAEAAKNVAAADAEMTDLMASLKDGRSKLASTPSQADAVSSGIEALPKQQGSFLSTFYANKTPATNQVRVTNGNFQY